MVGVSMNVGAYAKSIIRMIGGNLRRSLVLMLIASLGSAFFIGLRSSSPDMNLTFEHYLDQQNMFDIQLISNYGLTDGSMGRIRGAEGVLRADPAYSTDLFAHLGEDSFLFRFHSLAPPGGAGSMAASPMLTAGSLPTKSGECAVWAKFADVVGCAVGDTLTLSTGDDSLLSDFVARKTFVVTGFVQSPLYVRQDLGTSRKGNGSLQYYAYIPFDDFTMETYTDAFVFLRNPQGYSRFDSRFADLSAQVEDELQDIGDELTTRQRRIVMARIERAVAEGTAALETAMASLDVAEAELVETEQAFVEGWQALLRQRVALYDRVLDGRRGLEQGNAEAFAARLTLEQGRQALEEGFRALEALGALGIGDASVDAGAAAGLDTDALAVSATDEYSQSIQSALADLYSKAQELTAAEADLENSIASLASGASSLDAAWYAGLAQLAIAEVDFSIAGDALVDGQAHLLAERNAYAAMATAATQAISDVRQTLLTMPEAKCYVLGLDLNAGFESFRQDSDRIRSIAQAFPMFFFLVAALVSFTSMVRIVEDDRATAAVMQSLGYEPTAIFLKYIIYALSVAIPGTILGLAIGHRLFPTIIFDFGYRIMYLVPPVETPLYLPICAQVFVISLTSVLVPAALVSVSNMTAVPAELLRPKAPPAGKRIILERIHGLWRRMRFSAKVTARNILRYKKRFFMTVVGIAGCTAIVLTGFGLRDSIRTVAIKQFDQVYRFDFSITVSESKAARTSLERDLASIREVTDWQYQRRENVDAKLVGRGLSYTSTVVVPEDPERLPDFIRLTDVRRKTPIALSDEGAVITQKLASLLGLSAGDEILLVNDDDEEWTVRIAGVAENHVMHYVYMTPRLYAQIAGQRPDYNTIAGKSPGLDPARRDEISEYLLETGGAVTLTFNAKTRDFYTDLLDALNIVIFVLIVCGALLAFVVLFCLTGINIDERKREIATLKVLGFYDGEASSYIFRENTINTIAGSILGLAMGAVLHQYIIRTVELDMLVFGKVVEPASYAYAVCLTFLFTFIVNAVMSADIRDIDMIESLKSVE